MCVNLFTTMEVIYALTGRSRKLVSEKVSTSTYIAIYSILLTLEALQVIKGVEKATGCYTSNKREVYVYNSVSFFKNNARQ